MHTKQLTIFALSVITFVCVLSTSCKKDNVLPPDPFRDDHDSLVTMINGTTFATYNDNATGYHDTIQHYWTITGMQSTDSGIFVIFLYDTFAINQPVTTLISQIEYTPNNRAGYFNNLGVDNTTVTVTSLDTVKHIITGTFSGNLTGNGELYFGKPVTDTAFVTNGKFSVYYNISPATVQPPGNNP